MKLNTKKTIFVGFAFLLICMFWQVYDNVIAKILINSFGLNQTWSGLVMAFDNILAIILLPVFGALSDKTKTKYGKRTPYIFIGTIVAAILIVCVSFFDNAQLNKIKDENIQDVLTVEVVEDTTYSVQVPDEADNDINSFFNRVFGSGNDTTYTATDIEYEKGDKIYSFEYDGDIKFYESKEDASDARSLYIDDIRGENLGLFIGFIIVLCVVLIAMSVFRTPAVSLMPDVTPKPLRSKANAIINLMGSAGGIIALGFMTFLAKDYKSYTGCFVCLAGLMIVSLVIFLFKVNEPKQVEEMIEVEKEYGLADEIQTSSEENDNMPRDVRKSFILILFSIVFWYMAYNAATSKFSVYAGNVLNTGFTIPLLIAQAAAIICYIPIGILSSKLGRKKTVLIGVGILFAAFLLGSFLRESSGGLISVTMALAGIGWATINVNSYPMIVEMSKGNNVGKYTGIYYTASMAAQIVTPILSGIVMDATGKMTVLFPYCVFFCICAFITMYFVKHGDSKPIPQKKLEAFESMED